MKSLTPREYKTLLIFALCLYYISVPLIYVGKCCHIEILSYLFFVIALGVCLFFLFSTVFEHKLLKNRTYFEQYANKRVKQIEEQVRLVSGNPNAVLSDEDRARVRLEVKPDRKTTENYAKFFPLAAMFPLALTDWLLKNVGGSPYLFGIPLTVILLFAIAPFILSSLGSYIVLNSVDDKPLVGEIYKGYLEDNSDEVGSEVR